MERDQPKNKQQPYQTITHRNQKKESNQRETKPTKKSNITKLRPKIQIKRGKINNQITNKNRKTNEPK